MVLVRRPFFRYDPVRCDRPMLYGTVSERAANTIRFNTLWQWKGYRDEIPIFPILDMQVGNRGKCSIMDVFYTIIFPTSAHQIRHYQKEPVNGV